MLTGWGGRVRKAIAGELETARAAYEANGRKPFDAGFYEGLKLAVEILDAHEDKSVDFLSQALNEGNGTYKP